MNTTMHLFLSSPDLRYDGSDTVGAIRRCPGWEQLSLGVLNQGKDLQTLADLAEEQSLPLHELHTRIACQMAPQPEAVKEPDFAALSLDEIVDHLLRYHHRYTRHALRHLEVLIAPLARGEATSEQRGFRDLFLKLRQFLLAHLEDEEQGLFLHCRHLERSSRAGEQPTPDLRPLAAAITGHHEDIDQLLANVAAGLGCLSWPSDYLACQEAFQEAFQTFAADLARHAYIEYEYLLPQAVHLARLEQSRRDSQRPVSDRRSSSTSSCASC